MRLLQVTTTSQRRGAEVFAHQLGEQLRSRGHTVTTVALEQTRSGSDLAFEHLRHGRTDPRGISELVAAARRHDIAVAHGGSTLAPVMLAAGLARRPFVYRNIGDPEFWGQARFAGARVGAPLRRARHVVALYHGAARYMIDRYGLRASDVTVISNAVEAELFPAVDAARRSRARQVLGIGMSERVVGYLGALSEEKRPEWAVRAIERLPESTLLVAGEGALREQLEALVVATRAQDRVRFLGTTDQPAQFLSAIDVLVLPSRTEGIPGALLEAALTGVPTVATAVGGVAEVTSALHAGMTVGSGDLDGFVNAVRRVLSGEQAPKPDREAAIRDHALTSVADRWESILIGALRG
jgi:glycosyltransferase involved in cell wall biosynthesis